MSKKRKTPTARPQTQKRGTSALSSAWSGRRLILLALAVIVLIAPWVRGLHHDTGRVGILFLVFATSSIWLFVRDKRSGINLPVLILASVTTLYFLGVISPAGTNVAINAALNWAGFLAVFWLIIDLRPDENEKRWFLCGLVATATLMAFWGLLAYVGIGPETVLRNGGRLSPAFYYPNATASMLMVGLLLALLLVFTAKQGGRMRQALVASAVVLIPAFLLTMSRGAWLVFALCVIVLLLLNRREFARHFAFLFIVGLAGIIGTVAVTVLPNALGFLLVLSMAAGAALLESRMNYAYGKHVLAGVTVIFMLLSAFVAFRLSGENTYSLRPSEADSTQRISFDITVDPGEYTLTGFTRVSSASEVESGSTISVWSLADGNRDTRLLEHRLPLGESPLAVPVVIPAGILAVRVELLSRAMDKKVALDNPVLSGEQQYVLRSVAHILLPFQFASRVSQMDVTSLMADTRTIFFRDGWELFKQAPFFGQGGGTWRVKYGEVQSYFYGATHIHSDPYEVLLDTGIIGLMLYFAFVMVSIYYGFFGKSTMGRIAAVAALGVFVHSFGEALLAFPAMHIVMFAVLGLGAVESGRLKVPVPENAVRIASTVVVLVLTLVSASLYLAEREIVWQRENAETASAAEVQRSLRRILLLKPWAASQMADLANTLPPADFVKASDLLNRAVKLEPNDSPLLGRVAFWFDRRMDHENMLYYHGLALKAQPMNIQRYEAVAFSAATAMVREAPQRRDEALRLADVVLSVEQEFDLVLASSDRVLMRRNSLPLRMSQSFNLAVAQAHVLLGNYEEAKPYLAAAVRGGGDIANMALLWGLRVKQLEDGDSQELDSRLEELLVSDAHRSYWQMLHAATQP